MPEPVDLEWRTGAAGCLTPLAMGGACLFVYWARNPDNFTGADVGRRSGAILRLAGSFEWAGIRWGLLAIGVVLAWLAFQMLWRFVERVALTAVPKGLRMRGMFGQFIPWDEVVGVRFRGGKPGVIEITLTRARPGLFNPLPRKWHRVSGVEVDGGAGAAFSTAAEGLRAAGS